MAAAPPQERSAYPIWSHDKLRYNDTDRQGHVNNAVYATFLETGRVSFLEDERLRLVVPGCEFVLAHIEIDYLREVHYPGTVDIGTRVVRIGRSSFEVEQAIFSGDTCAATGRCICVQIDSKLRKSHPLSEAMTSWLGERLAK